MTKKEIMFETIKLLTSGIQKRKKCISTMQQHYNEYKARLKCLDINTFHSHNMFLVVREYLYEEMMRAKECWKELNELQKQDTLFLKKAEENFNKEE